MFRQLADMDSLASPTSTLTCLLIGSDTRRKKERRKNPIPLKNFICHCLVQMRQFADFFFYKKRFQSPCVQLLINKCDSSTRITVRGGLAGPALLTGSLIIPVTDHKQSLQYSIAVLIQPWCCVNTVWNNGNM